MMLWAVLFVLFFMTYLHQMIDVTNLKLFYFRYFWIYYVFVIYRFCHAFSKEDASTVNTDDVASSFSTQLSNAKSFVHIFNAFTFFTDHFNSVKWWAILISFEE